MPLAASWAIASTPPIVGIRRSMSTTSTSTLRDRRERLGAVAGLADDLEVRVAGEDAAEAVAHDRVVVDDEQPDRAVTAAQGSRR